MKQKTTFNLLLTLMLMVFCGNGVWGQRTDVLTADNLYLGNSYTNFTTSDSSSFLASYQGNAMMSRSNAIQLRSNSSSGIVTTASKTKALSVTVVWNAETSHDRALDIYGQNTPFTSSADLYNQATKIGTIDHSKSETTLLITKNYNYIGLRSKKSALYLDSISIEWEKAGTPIDSTKQNQPISFGKVTNFEVTKGQNFTAPTLSGAKTTVTYESSNKAVATVNDSTGAVTLAGAIGMTTITAKAAASNTYNAAIATYTLTVKAASKSVANIDEFLKVTDDAIYTFKNPVIVVKQHYSDLWIKDSTGYINVHGKLDHKYNLGDEIPAGISGSLGKYNEMPQINNPKNFKPANRSGLEVVPEEKQISNISKADINKYVILRKVTFGKENLSDSLNTIAFYNKFKLGKIPNDKNSYNVTCIVGYYKNLQIYPISIEKVSTGKLNQNLTFAQTEYTVKAGEVFTAPQVQGAKTTVTYKSSNTQVATVEAKTGAVKVLKDGVTVITATAAASEKYDEGNAEYKLTVLPNITGESLPFKQVGGHRNLGQNFINEGINEDYKATDANLKFGKTGTKLTMVLAEAPATLSYFIRLNGTTNFGKFIVETSADGNEYAPLKVYNDSSFTTVKELNEIHLSLNENVRYIRWTYAQKKSGNIGLGSIMVTKKGDSISSPLAMSAVKHATFYAAKSVIVPEGLTANIATVNGTKVVLTAKYNEGNVIPANTPVLFTGLAGDYQLYTTNIPTQSSKDKNDLRGTLSNDVITAPNGKKLYILAKDETNGLGFYFQGKNGDGSQVSNLAGKAYLEVPATLAVKGFRLNEGEATGIESVEASEGNAMIYTLNGMRIHTNKDNLPKGIYIINGKKLLVK